MDLHLDVADLSVKPQRKANYLDLMCSLWNLYRNGLIPTMSARWLSPIVKLCFPAEASWLCFSTNCMFFSHTVLLKATSVWNKNTISTVWLKRIVNTIWGWHCSPLPDYHKPCHVWFSTLPILYSRQMKYGHWPGIPRAILPTECTSCKNK